MKTQTNYITILFLSLCLGFTSCGKIQEIDIPSVSEEFGSLTLKALLKKEINVTTGKPPTVEEVLNNIIVEIYSLDDETGNATLFINSNYGDLPTIIELLTGEYLIQMYSSDLRANQYSTRWDIGDYSWSSNFSINPGNNTNINAQLTLSDTALTIDYTDEILTEYPDINVNASFTYTQSGVTQFIDWTALEDERTHYFNMTEFTLLAFDGYESLFSFSGALNLTISGGSGFITRSYPDVRPNEHYIITISYSGDSSATLIVTLGDETIIEDEIPFPG